MYPPPTLPYILVPVRTIHPLFLPPVPNNHHPLHPYLCTIHPLFLPSVSYNHPSPYSNPCNSPRPNPYIPSTSILHPSSLVPKSFYHPPQVTSIPLPLPSTLPLILPAQVLVPPSHDYLYPRTCQILYPIPCTLNQSPTNPSTLHPIPNILVLHHIPTIILTSASPLPCLQFLVLYPLHHIPIPIYIPHTFNLSSLHPQPYPGLILPPSLTALPYVPSNHHHCPTPR